MKPSTPANAGAGHALDHPTDLLRVQAAERQIDGDPERRRIGQQLVEEGPIRRGRPRRDRALPDRLRGVRHDPGQVELGDPAESLAGRAGAQCAVEPEQVRLGLDVLGPAPAASPAADEGPRNRPPPGSGNGPGPWRTPTRSSPGDARGVPAADQPVDDHVDRAGFRQGDARIVQPERLAADGDPREALGAKRTEQGLAVALGSEIQRETRSHSGCRAAGRRSPSRRWPGVAGTTGEPQLRQIDLAGPGEEQGEGVVDLGDRADRAPAGLAALRPGDGDGRRDAVDPVGVRLVQLLEELAGIRRERLDVSALPFGVERVERQRALPRPADPGDGDQPIERQVEIHPLEVMGPHAAQADRTRGIDGPLLPLPVPADRRFRRVPAGCARTRTSSPTTGRRADGGRTSGL